MMKTIAKFFSAVALFLVLQMLLTLQLFCKPDFSDFSGLLTGFSSAYVDSRTSDEIRVYYDNCTIDDVFSSEINSRLVQQIPKGKGKTVERSVLVHTFSVSDFSDFGIVSFADAGEYADSLIEDIYFSIQTSFAMKYVSTQIFDYGAVFSLNGDAETDTVNEILIHVAMSVGSGYRNQDLIHNAYIKPAVEKWNALPIEEKIFELNRYILEDTLTYDPEKEYRSTYVFLTGKKGSDEDFAGLTALFLDEMEIENIIVNGYIQIDGELRDHTWNLAKIGSLWYNIDILWNAMSQNDFRCTDYLLKSAETFEKDHLVSSIYSDYVKLSDADYDFSEILKKYPQAESESDPEIPPEEEPVEDNSPEKLFNDAVAELDGYLTQANDLILKKSTHYSEKSIETLQQVYEKAESVRNDETSDINAIKTQSILLKDTMDGMVEIVEADKTNLYKQLSKAYTAFVYDYALYTADSLNAMIPHYESAVLVYQNPTASQNKVDDAYYDLRKYLKALVVIENTEEETTSSGEYVPSTDFVPGNPTEQEQTTDQPINPEKIIPADLPVDPQPEVLPESEDSVEPEDPVGPEEPVESENSTEPGEQGDIPVENDHPAEEPIQEDPPEDDPSEEKEDIPTKPIEKPEKNDSNIAFYVVVAGVAFGVIVYMTASRIVSSFSKKKKHNKKKNDSEKSKQKDPTSDSASELKETHSPSVSENPPADIVGDAEIVVSLDDLKKNKSESDGAEPASAEEKAEELPVKQPVQIAEAEPIKEESSSVEKAEEIPVKQPAQTVKAEPNTKTEPMPAEEKAEELPVKQPEDIVNTKPEREEISPSSTDAAGETAHNIPPKTIASYFLKRKIRKKSDK